MKIARQLPLAGFLLEPSPIDKDQIANFFWRHFPGFLPALNLVSEIEVLRSAGVSRGDQAPHKHSLGHSRK